MPRLILDEQQVHPAVRERVATYHRRTVDEVREAAARYAVLVVGMAVNPWPRRARRLLAAAGVAHHYLEYGSYFGQWRRRSALKMWTGWPTFPMVFVKGTLVGGAQDPGAAAEEWRAAAHARLSTPGGRSSRSQRHSSAPCPRGGGASRQWPA
jgi:hypothetical protein